MTAVRFFTDSLRGLLRGSPAYWRWLGLLAVLFGAGLWAYSLQLRYGLVVTGMSDQVSWGFYISNFAFLVGIAAAAVLLVIPAYIFHRQDVKAVVQIGEGLAVAAVVCAMMFVLADLGRPERAWHLIPFIGRMNWPCAGTMPGTPWSISARRPWCSSARRRRSASIRVATCSWTSAPAKAACCCWRRSARFCASRALNCRKICTGRP